MVSHYIFHYSIVMGVIKDHFYWNVSRKVVLFDILELLLSTLNDV